LLCRRKDDFGRAATQAVFFMERTGMANNQPVYLTADGLKKVQEEYEYLTETRRKEVAQMIAEAKAEGDISENAGYDEAKTAQGFLEGRIRELENILKNAKVIEDHEQPSDVVSLGRTVVVREEGTDYEESYTIVGAVEADPANGRVSNESPMGKALLDKKVGQRATVDSPGGTIVFEILSVA
jgi:transcription elongation factor GreA